MWWLIVPLYVCVATTTNAMHNNWDLKKISWGGITFGGTAFLCDVCTILYCKQKLVHHENSIIVIEATKKNRQRQLGEFPAIDIPEAERLVSHCIAKDTLVKKQQNALKRMPAEGAVLAFSLVAAALGLYS